MLPKKHRVSKQVLPNVLSRGRFAHSSHFLLRFMENNLEIGRFSVVVPKKVAKLATSRNSLKRKVNAVLEGYKNALPQGDHVIFAKKGLENMGFSEIKAEIVELVGLKSNGLVPHITYNF